MTQLQIAKRVYLAVEGVRVIRGLDEPPPEAVVVYCADVALAVARVDHGAGVGGVGVVADPALGTTQVVLVILCGDFRGPGTGLVLRLFLESAISFPLRPEVG